MKSELKRHEDGTITVKVSIPANDIKKEWEREVSLTVKTAEVAGFRKGKAPKGMVEGKINKEKIKDDVLKKLLPNAYINAIQEHKLQPIMTPHIHVEKIEEGQDWIFVATTCEAPEIILGKYKDAVKNVTAKSKIIIPGKENEKQEPKLEIIMPALLSEIQMSIPKILIEKEVERLLAQLLDEIKSLGLALDQYLASTQKTVEQIKEDYTKKAENDIKFEFAIQKIADEEKIIVEPKEIEEAMLQAKDPKERENLERNRYLLANVLRQQKTLDFLKSL